MSVRTLKKGDEVWEVQIEYYERVSDPRIWHGVVTGGGPNRVLIDWFDARIGQRPGRYGRSQIQREVYATRAEALEGALRRLEVLLHRAVERVDQVTDVRTSVQDLLDNEAEPENGEPATSAEVLLACGCPAGNLFEVHQEGCKWSQQAIAERQLERSLDEQQ